MDTAECATCGSTIPSESPSGICPVCLISGMLGEPEREANADAPALVEGEIIDGRYRIGIELGHGGWSAVYLAERLSANGGQVAVKVLRSGFETERHLARFEEERQALMAATHPYCAEMFDSGTTDAGQPFIVMEFIAGLPITEFCAINRLELPSRLELIQRVLEAIGQAHRCSIVHRDLKPGNILVVEATDGAIPKVIDFGLARMGPRPAEVAELFTKQFQVVGTPAYMSPEQTLGGGTEVDLRSDIYSLGVVLYELVTGKLPFSEHRLRVVGQELLRIIREDPVPPPSSQSEKTTERMGLDELVLTALAKDPGARYRDAEAFGEAISHWLRKNASSSGIAGWFRRKRR